MENKRAYSAKGVLTALGKSLLYLLFFLAIQFLAGIIYAVIAVAGASLFHGEADAGSVLAGTETAVLFAYLLTAAAILLWFRLRHKPLGEAAGLRRWLRLDGQPSAAFAAVGCSWYWRWRWRCCRRCGCPTITTIWSSCCLPA